MLRLLQDRNRQELVTVRNCSAWRGSSRGGDRTVGSVGWLLREQNTPWLCPEKPMGVAFLLIGKTE